MTLEESIRYRPGDPIESWLNSLLCLDASAVRPISSGCPPPEQCDLYYINRDTLFCYHRASEAFLQRLVALYVASHYKVGSWVELALDAGWVIFLDERGSQSVMTFVRCFGKHLPKYQSDITLKDELPL